MQRCIVYELRSYPLRAGLRPSLCYDAGMSKDKQEREICEECDGCGTMPDDSTCKVCRGRGTVIKKTNKDKS